MAHRTGLWSLLGVLFDEHPVLFLMGVSPALRSKTGILESRKHRNEVHLLTSQLASLAKLFYPETDVRQVYIYLGETEN